MMTIEIAECTRALWYLELPGGNWTATLDALESGAVILHCRFRWYKGRPKIWDSDDIKNGYTVTGTDAAAMIEAARGIIRVSQKKGAGRSWELLRGTGSLEDFFNQFVELPFVHSRKATPEEAKALMETRNGG